MDPSCAQIALTVRNLTQCDIRVVGYQLRKTVPPSSASAITHLIDYAVRKATDIEDIVLIPFERPYVVHCGRSVEIEDQVPTCSPSMIELLLASDDSVSGSCPLRFGGHEIDFYSEVGLISLTAIYNCACHHLTLLSIPSPDQWMKALHDDVPLSALSIPGTHNSPACHVAMPTVRCQSVDIPEQLQHGIRFLDIRVRSNSSSSCSASNLMLVHASFSVSWISNYYLVPLLEQIHDFLSLNPSETVITSLKCEGNNSGMSEAVASTLNSLISADSRWYKSSGVPKLKDVRGKIVLLRRFHLKNSLGLDASVWPDNTAHAFCASGEVCIQDFYDIKDSTHAGAVIQYAKDQLKRSSKIISDADRYHTPLRGPLYLNFLTASNLWRRDCWPERIAETTNAAIMEYLCVEHGDNSSTGVVICDWVGLRGDWKIIRLVIAMNTFQSS